MKAPRFYGNKPDTKEQEVFYREVAQKLTDVDARIAEAQTDSTAASVEGLAIDFNALLAKLRTAGLLAE
jgi:hypothetical protein